MQYADLQALTDEVVSLLEDEISKERIELVRTYKGETQTLVNEGHYQQMILSLVRNARQAIGHRRSRFLRSLRTSLQLAPLAAR